MSISVEAKIVLIHDSSSLLILFTEPSQFSCELHLKTKSNWVHGSKQYSYWLIKNAETHSAVMKKAQAFKWVHQASLAFVFILILICTRTCYNHLFKFKVDVKP